jgi:4-carboxymuconolactone decarboxylase
MSDPFAQMIRQMMESSQAMLRAFNPALEKQDFSRFDKAFPTLPADMMEMWFGRPSTARGWMPRPGFW